MTSPFDPEREALTWNLENAGHINLDRLKIAGAWVDQLPSWCENCKNIDLICDRCHRTLGKDTYESNKISPAPWTPDESTEYGWRRPDSAGEAMIDSYLCEECNSALSDLIDIKS